MDNVIIPELFKLFCCVHLDCHYPIHIFWLFTRPLLLNLHSFEKQVLISTCNVLLSEINNAPSIPAVFIQLIYVLKILKLLRKIEKTFPHNSMNGQAQYS